MTLSNELVSADDLLARFNASVKRNSLQFHKIQTLAVISQFLANRTHRAATISSQNDSLALFDQAKSEINVDEAANHSDAIPERGENQKPEKCTWLAKDNYLFEFVYEVRLFAEGNAPIPESANFSLLRQLRAEFSESCRTKEEQYKKTWQLCVNKIGTFTLPSSTTEYVFNAAFWKDNFNSNKTGSHLVNKGKGRASAAKKAAATKPAATNTTHITGSVIVPRAAGSMHSFFSPSSAHSSSASASASVISPASGSASASASASASVSSPASASASASDSASTSFVSSRTDRSAGDANNSASATASSNESATSAIAAPVLCSFKITDKLNETLLSIVATRKKPNVKNNWEDVRKNFLSHSRAAGLQDPTIQQLMSAHQKYALKHSAQETKRKTEQAAGSKQLKQAKLNLNASASASSSASVFNHAQEESFAG